MIKHLKLQKAVYAIVLGIIALIASVIMRNADINGSSIVLTISGVFLILGSLMFIYPILFAKKVDDEGTKVELQPVAKETPKEEVISE